MVAEEKLALPNANFFAAVKYHVIGGSLQLETLLKAGGAKKKKYLSDDVTHCLVTSPGPAETSELQDIYDIHEIPVIKGDDWIKFSVKCGQKLPVSCFEAVPTKVASKGQNIFKGLHFSVSGLEIKDINRLWALIRIHGGQFSREFRGSTTHLICGRKSGGLKFEKATTKKDVLNVITPDFVTQCISEKKLLPENSFHPRLLVTPGDPIETPQQQQQQRMTSMMSALTTAVTTEVTKVSNKDHREPKGKYVLAAKVTEAKEDNLETPMEEDDPNEPGDKLNDSVNRVLATPLEPDLEEELPNIKSVPSSQVDEISKEIQKLNTAYLPATEKKPESITEYQENSSNSLIKPPLPVFKDTSNNSASGGSKKNVLANVFKGFVFYGVTFDLCRFCTFLNSAQLAGLAKFKYVQNQHKSNVTP